MSTPHIQAGKGEIAKTVLMPGDPLRARFIAENYLEGAVRINEIRGMYGFTGRYKGKEVSVMGSGMGMPSIGIYSYELFSVYDVENIIRIGSAGSYCEEAKLYDVVLADVSYSESSFAKVQNGYDKDLIYPSKSLNDKIETTAVNLNIPLLKGCIHSSDVFYQEGDPLYYKKLYKEKNCICVEMESFALFHNANVWKKNAACLLTISDSFVTNEKATVKERETSFTNMMSVALESIFA